MIKWKSHLFTVFVLITFTWFCMVGEFTFAQDTDTDLLNKIQKMSLEGDYEGAINLLKDFIVKFKIKQGKKEDLAMAYYLLGRTYYMVGMDDQCNESLLMVFKVNPEFSTNERDVIFREYVKKIQEKGRSKLKEEFPEDVSVKIDKTQPEAEEKAKIEEKKPAIKSEPKQEKKTAAQLKDKTKQEMDTKSAMTAAYKIDQTKPEKKEEISEKQPEAKVKANDEELKPEKKVISKSTKKKSKKKFPWLLVIGGVAVVGVILYFLLKPKDDTLPDDGDTGIIPNYDTAVLGIEWINIPAGEFLMGDNFNEGDPDELPVHAVYLASYSISKYEVTFDQYDKFCEETNRNMPSDEGWGRENRPVINVSWEDAKDFCDWLSEKTGKNIHFPTEARWEKAARGTDQRRYPWGNSAPDCSILNYNNCIGKTQPVGSYPSGVSTYGVYDMAGNVTEYCQDWYLPDYYSISTYTDPTGPDLAALRVFRGGSWNVTALSVRAAYRYYNNPSNRSKYWGFRLAMD